ncbi:MAG: putative basic amino acid antiporter YfcC [Firmicutes bacterium]|nr:putative basic amino acid antiporter YfcC [Bacillota bacterium]
MSKKTKGEGLKSLNKGFKVPDTYIIIFFVVVLAMLLTFLIPQGYYETEEVTYIMNGVEKTRTVIKDGSFQYLLDENGNPMTVGASLFATDGSTGFFNYMYNGIISSSAIEIIAFLLTVGGAFGILLRTGAIESGIMGMIKKTNGKEKFLIPILFVLFSLGGAVFGMGEEALPFLMILAPILVAMGYDSITAVLITYCATQIGFGASWMNPFSVGIAQGIAGVEVFSGAEFRMPMWFVFTAAGCIMTMMYATKIKKDPLRSLAHESDAYFREHNEAALADGNIQKFGTGHILVLLTLVVTMVWVIWGVMVHGYYMAEIATQFFIMGVVAGVIGVVFKLNGMKLNDIASSFKTGAADLIGAALVVAMAQGIMQVLGGADPTAPTVLNTVLFGISEAFAGLSGTVAAVLMYLFQSVFNFFVVSGSGQAALTMPIMAPLADLLDVSRQVAVLAFQLGDAFTNLIVPTSGCLIGSLAIAKIDWATWAKFVWKFLGVLVIMAVGTIILATVIGF